MAETILVPVDGSDPADAALEYALDRFPDAHLIVYHAIDPFTVAATAGEAPTRERDWTSHVEAAQRESESILAAARDRVDDAATEVELDAELGPPADNIVDYANTRDADHVIVGSHGRTGLARAVLGSVAEEVARRAPAPVTIVHPDESS